MQRMIQISLFRSSHRASWSYHRLGLGVFALLCPESSGIGFLYTKRHLRPFAWAKKYARTNETSQNLKEEKATHNGSLDGRMLVFFPTFPIAIWERLLNETTTTTQNARLKLQEEWLEKTTEKLTTPGRPGIVTASQTIGYWCHISDLSKNLQHVLGANFRLKIIEVMISAISTMYHSPPTNISWYLPVLNWI